MGLKEQDIVFTTKDANGNTVLQMPITRLDNVEGALKTVNNLKPDANGNVAVNDYVTGLSVSGQEITYTKKDGSSGKITTKDTVYTHPVSGVTAGTYNNVTVNDLGHVTAGENVRVVKTVNGNTPDDNGNITPDKTGCLPLSGGTMTGVIYSDRGQSGPALANKEGGVSGGQLYFFKRGDKTYDGGFILRAIAEDGSNFDLRGQANGELKWCGVLLPVPTGAVIAFAANSAPSGYLLCNGAAVSRTNYASLYAKIGTTYGSGDGSTTFNLPNLTDRFIQGSGKAGTYKSAGLPNVSAIIGIGVNSTVNGALISKGGVIQTHGSGNVSVICSAEFSASGSSSIYGNSSTVQPPALTMRYYIKY